MLLIQEVNREAWLGTHAVGILGVATKNKSLLLLLLLVGVGFWTQFFALAKQALPKQVPYCLSHTSCPFCNNYFGDGVS
jgi:hypothetical protein